MPFCYLTKESGSNDILTHLFRKSSIKLRWSFHHLRAHLKIPQNASKHRSIQSLFFRKAKCYDDQELRDESKKENRLLRGSNAVILIFYKE